MKSKRLTSERRAAASRANGAKSLGPVTERGKYNSSLNSRRHGLLSRWLLLPGEMPELFKEQYNDFMEEHQPRTPTERALVEEMVTSWWRKQRVWGMESARITFQVKLSASMGHAVPVNDPATRTALAVGDLADSSRCLDLLLRYETRYERQFHRALARLLDLKSRDPEPPNDAVPPALLPAIPPALLPAILPAFLPSRDSDGAVHTAPPKTAILPHGPQNPLNPQPRPLRPHPLFRPSSPQLSRLPHHPSQNYASSPHHPRSILPRKLQKWPPDAVFFLQPAPPGKQNRTITLIPFVFCTLQRRVASGGSNRLSSERSPTDRGKNSIWP